MGCCVNRSITYPSRSPSLSPSFLSSLFCFPLVPPACSLPFSSSALLESPLSVLLLHLPTIPSLLPWRQSCGSLPESEIRCIKQNWAVLTKVFNWQVTHRVDTDGSVNHAEISRSTHIQMWWVSPCCFSPFVSEMFCYMAIANWYRLRNIGLHDSFLVTDL